MNALLIAHVGGGPVALVARALASAALADMLCWRMRRRLAHAIARSKQSTNHGPGVHRVWVPWPRGAPRTTTRRIPLSFLESEASEPSLELLPTPGWRYRVTN